MDIAEQGRLGQVEEIVVALNVPVEILESVAPECGFVQLLVLDHGAHATIEDDDAFLEGLMKLFQAGSTIGHREFFRGH